VILVDTNVLVAAARTADTNHDAAARLLETLDQPLLVPPTVLAEVCYLLNEWGGPAVEARFLRDVRPGGLQLAELTTADVARMADLVERYADLRLGGTDASPSPSPSACASIGSPPSTGATSRSSAPPTSRRSHCFPRSRQPDRMPAEPAHVRSRNSRMASAPGHGAVSGPRATFDRVGFG